MVSENCLKTSHLDSSVNAQCFRDYENISFTAEIEKILISDLSSGQDRMSWLHSALDPTTTNDTIVTSPPPQWPSFRRDIKTLALIRVKFWLTLKIPKENFSPDLTFTK